MFSTATLAIPRSRATSAAPALALKAAKRTDALTEGGVRGLRSRLHSRSVGSVDGLSSAGLSR
eukprot:scaffold20811_cov97-Isochrysis_galbana.AAC.2